MNWTVLRVLVLALFTGVLVLMGLRILQTSTDRRTIAASLSSLVTLPQKVPLENWEFQSSQALKPIDLELDNWLAGRRYQYQYQNRPLTIDMRYFVNTGIADVRLYIYHNHTSNPIDLQIQETPQLGYFGLSSNATTAFLDACIPPRGQGTVTAFQFQNNLYMNNTNVTLLMDWLLGRSFRSFLDDRCLWARLSTPRGTKTIQNTYLFLEQAWENWYLWWFKYYPTIQERQTVSDSPLHQSLLLRSPHS